jgi:type 1 glutamine amidotransferase
MIDLREGAPIPQSSMEIVMRTRLQCLIGLVLAVMAWKSAQAGGDDPCDQSGVPLEVQPSDLALTKIVLVAGRASHGPGEHEFFAGCALLSNLLSHTPGVFPVMARDGWPKHPKTFSGARSVVFFMDGGANHPIIRDKHPEEIGKLMDAGVGFVNLHYAVEYPKAYAPAVLDWLGGYYETGYSINPHWKADIRGLPDHPITRGVRPFALQDEWYYNMRFPPGMKGVVPILRAVPPDETRRTDAAREHPGRAEVLAWAHERANGGRSFGFTGGHFHRNWGDESLRRLVVNAILWTARVEVPASGARVDMTPSDLNRNLDRKPARNP